MKYFWLQKKQYFKYSYIHNVDTPEPPQLRSAGKESCRSEQNGLYLPNEGIAKTKLTSSRSDEYLVEK